jgi:uncharacterized protein YbjQ (UPF0145 family)
MPTFDDQKFAQETARGREPFSSTFSTRELLLVKNIGVTPISLVMGTAFVRLPRDKYELLLYMYGTGYGGSLSSGGWQPSAGSQFPGGAQSPGSSQFPGGSHFPHRDQSGAPNIPYRRSTSAGRMASNLGNPYSMGSVQPVTGQIYELTSMRLNARKLAVGRMRQEAEDLGASGVIAVRMKTEVHNWGDCLTLECTAMGTAVSVPGWQEEEPFTSLMHAQQFWRLWQSGYQPCGIAVGACSYSDCAERSVLQRAYNQEVASYTASFYDAHALAMEAFSKDVRLLKGTGAVGMDVEYEFQDAEKELEVREGVSMTYLHLITHFVITGTAIKRREGAVSTPPQRTLRILDLSHHSEKRQDAKESVRIDANISGDAKE